MQQYDIHSSLRMRPGSVVNVRFALDDRRNGRRRRGLADEVVRCSVETTLLVNTWASNGARSLSSVLSKKQ